MIPGRSRVTVTVGVPGLERVESRSAAALWRAVRRGRHAAGRVVLGHRLGSLRGRVRPHRRHVHQVRHPLVDHGRAHPAVPPTPSSSSRSRRCEGWKPHARWTTASAPRTPRAAPARGRRGSGRRRTSRRRRTAAPASAAPAAPPRRARAGRPRSARTEGGADVAGGPGDHDAHGVRYPSRTPASQTSTSTDQLGAQPLAEAALDRGHLGARRRRRRRPCPTRA